MDARVPGRLASTPGELKDEAFGRPLSASEPRAAGTSWLKRATRSSATPLLDPLLAVTSHVVVLTIAVHEGHQGQGIGKQLGTSHRMGDLQSPDRKDRTSRVRSANRASAIGLYQKLGFVEEGRMINRLKIGPGVTSMTS